jgi:hypothetical protein
MARENPQEKLNRLRSMRGNDSSNAKWERSRGNTAAAEAFDVRIENADEKIAELEAKTGENGNES